MSAITEQKCPCCGGAVEFNIGAQKLKCPYCDTEFDVADFPQENETEEQEEINWSSQGSEWSEGEADGMSVYSCKSCGGQIVADSTTGATACPYCGNQVVVKGKFSGELRPDLVIPFKLDKKAAKEAMRKHITTKKFVPKAFKDNKHIDEIKGVYVPYWLFTCDAAVDAEYTAHKERTWSDSEYNYVETETFKVYRSGSIGFDNVPVDGSSKMPDDLMESIEPFDISQAVDFNTAYLAGYLADKYDVSAHDSMGRANQRIKHSAGDAFESTVEGYTSVNASKVNMNVANGCYKYALYPVWILKTKWNGKNYTFAMNGQTGKFVGDIPTDKKAVNIARLLLGGGLSALLYAILWIAELFG